MGSRCPRLWSTGWRREGLKVWGEVWLPKPWWRCKEAAYKTWWSAGEGARRAGGDSGPIVGLGISRPSGSRAPVCV